MNRRTRLTLWFTALLCGLLAGYAATRWLLPGTLRPVPWEMPGEWIAAPGPAGAVSYFRQTIDLPADARHAWVAVSASDGFELVVNGSVLGIQSLWRPNRSFQSSSTERGQRLNQMRPVNGVSYARDYQWETAANYRVPTFFDLTNALRPGRNVIAIRVDARGPVNRLRLAGGITLATGQQIALHSDGSWKATARPQATISKDWFDRSYPDLDWPVAQVVTGPRDFVRTFEPGVFTTPFAAPALAAPARPRGESVVFQTTWHLDRAPDDAWMRVRTNRAYELLINGHRATPPTLGSDELTGGSWIVHTAFATGQRWEPDALDPDDADTLFGDETATAKADRPVGVLRDGQVEAFDAFDLRTLLRSGDNTISVRLVNRGAALQWTPQLALDGHAATAGTIATLTTSRGWTAQIGTAAPQPALVIGEADSARPRMRYLGVCPDGFSSILARAALIATITLLALAAAWRLGRFPGAAALGIAGFAAASAILASAITLACCFAARDEVLWTAPGAPWAAALLLASAAAIAVVFIIQRGWRPIGDRRHLAFAVALTAVLLVCGFTRAYRADFQPTDADEWASLQTILAIVETGTPQLTPEAYYTRSPFYHYLTAASVALFGPTFWAMRLPAAGFAVGTCALIVLCGAHLLRSRWVGLGAALIFALHPLAIDMAHQVRFYQQQQFFTLLTYYAFCRGFIGEQKLWARYLALGAFFGAVFSQEISVMIPLAFVPGYVLYAQAKDWRTEGKWLLVAACGMVFVVLDFVIFKSVCLTRLEGVSPRIEPALGLNFMFPSTLYWIFSLYSRLHVGLTVVFLAGLALLLRSRDRQVLTLLITFAAGIVFSVILITGVGLRFQYWLFPLFFLLAVHGARLLASAALGPVRAAFGQAAAWPQGALASALVLMIVLSFSPWKIPGSYETRILPDVDGAFAYVRQKIAAGDALAVAAPHTAAATCEIGHVDYDIELPLLQDFVYRKDGRLIDRNGGAQVIDRVDEFQDAIARHDRVWVVLNRDIRFRSPGSRIAWQSPGARFDLFVRTNLQLVHQTYLTDVFLWDQSKGRLRGFRRTL